MATKDEFGRHEVLDRAHMIQVMFEMFVIEHDVTVDDPELATLADSISTQLFAFYQLCGRKFL
jgi:hypothetical protein